MDVTQENVVSVWLGAGVGEAEFAELLTPRGDGNGGGDAVGPPSAFAAAFGIASYDHDYLEAAFEPDNRPVAALLDGVSYGASFVEAVAQLAVQAGLPEANAAALLYDVAYVLDPDAVAPGNALRFIGAFPYDPETEPD